ncbi:MAG TPA: choice-of-anchor D domain-containing protein [Rhodanobacteraceae bacterium]|nr:choice-of-anchor D domain-containing protein [Rhodanobacteraceae bacterium]
MSILPIARGWAARNIAVRCCTVLAALLCLTLLGHAAPARAVDPYIFQSSPAAAPGGGLAVSNTQVSGYTFRVTSRVQVSEVGAQLSTYASTSPSVFIALHHVGTPVSGPDAMTDSNLMAVALVNVTSNTPSDYSAPLVATLEPGWYSITVGTGKHGATATNFQVSLDATNIDEPADTFGPYSFKNADNSRTLQGTHLRLFVRGTSLTAVPPDPNLFKLETALPTARAANTFYPLATNNNWFATRFSLTKPTYVDRVSGWFFLLGNSGNLFAAVLQLPNSGSTLPSPGSTAFNNAQVACTLINVGTPSEEYAGNFSNLLLAPGNYVLVFGTDHCGATGTPAILGTRTTDSTATVNLWDGNGWNWTVSAHIALEGVAAQLTASPDPLDFGTIPAGATPSQTVTVTNIGGTAVNISTLTLGGIDAAQFGIGTETCSSTTLAPQATCDITVRYQPVALGNHAAQLAIASDGVPNPLNVALNGETVPGFLVTPSVTGAGSINPAIAQTVVANAQPAFVLSPDPHNHVASVTGSCGGNLVGTTYTTAPVSANCDVVANFAIDSYTLTYSAGANGSITGTTPQTVNYGDSGSAVSAAPATGYHFVDWSDGSTANPRTDSNVSTDISVSANFAINTYTLTYSAGANGSISGTTPQTVDYGTAGTAVTATPGTGYHFVQWSDGSTTNPRIDSNVTADVSVSASFAINSYTLTYSADPNGSITGTSPQTVNYGSNGTAVTAVPANGYHFTDWSDGNTTNPRTDSNVSADINVMARFSLIPTFAVTATVNGGHGTVLPASVAATSGQVVQFTLSPDNGYRIGSVSGCGGSLSGNVWTTAPITAACAVDVQFVAIVTYTPVPATDRGWLLLLAGLLGAIASWRLGLWRRRESAQ